MKNHPIGCSQETQYLLDGFASRRNGYPRRLLNSWLIKFDRQIREDPELLNFHPKSQILEQNTISDHLGELGENVVPKKVLLVPYVSGVSEKLRRIAARYQISTWYSYSGKLGDSFKAAYKEGTHISKSRNMVYEMSCSCGTKYVGESCRNLKVRMAEHCDLKHSSSVLSNHLKIGNAHQLLENSTQILTQERQIWKRKLLESLLILNNPQPLCNSRPSTEVSNMWCACELRLHCVLGGNV